MASMSVAYDQIARREKRGVVDHNDCDWNLRSNFDYHVQTYGSGNAQ